MNAPRTQRRSIPIVLAALCAAVLAAGCSAAPTAPPPSATPGPTGPWTGLLADYRVVWSAEPGIDLLSGPAVVVRAYEESIIGAVSGGSADFLYPGFERAAPRDAPPPAPRWPGAGNADRHPQVGTDRYHILRIEPAGANIIAVYCSWGYGTADDLGDGKYGEHSPQNPGYDAVAAMWIALTPPPNGASPLPPQKGPAPAPADDVFGGWRVAQRLPGLPGDTRVPPEWPTMIDDVNTCVATAPDPPDRRLFLTHGTHPRSDFPTLPPFPGWPAASTQ